MGQVSVSSLERCRAIALSLAAPPRPPSPRRRHVTVPPPRPPSSCHRRVAVLGVVVPPRPLRLRRVRAVTAPLSMHPPRRHATAHATAHHRLLSSSATGPWPPPPSPSISAILLRNGTRPLPPDPWRRRGLCASSSATGCGGLHLNDWPARPGLHHARPWRDHGLPPPSTADEVVAEAASGADKAVAAYMAAEAVAEAATVMMTATATKTVVITTF